MSQALTYLGQIKTLLEGLSLDQLSSWSKPVNITFNDAVRLEDMNINGRLRAAAIDLLAFGPSPFWRVGQRRYTSDIAIRVIYPIINSSSEMFSLASSDSEKIHKALLAGFNGPQATIDCSAGIFRSSSVNYTKTIGKGRQQASVLQDCYILNQNWSVHLLPSEEI